VEHVLSQGPPNPRYGQPAGTMSQRVAFVDGDGVKIAVCHQYRRPDGSLGASGKPDPKRISHGGALYALHLTEQTTTRRRPEPDS
jgi:hypothetical protein